MLYVAVDDTALSFRQQRVSFALSVRCSAEKKQSNLTTGGVVLLLAAWGAESLSGVRRSRPDGRSVCRSVGNNRDLTKKERR